MRPGQGEGLGADERRHHVEQQHERHEEGGRQQQHRSAEAGAWGGRRRHRRLGLRCAGDHARPRAVGARCLGSRRGAGRRPEGKRRSLRRARPRGAALPVARGPRPPPNGAEGPLGSPSSQRRHGVLHPPPARWAASSAQRTGPGRRPPGAPLGDARGWWQGCFLGPRRAGAGPSRTALPGAGPLRAVAPGAVRPRPEEAGRSFLSPGSGMSAPR